MMADAPEFASIITNAKFSRASRWATAPSVSACAVYVSDFFLESGLTVAVTIVSFLEYLSYLCHAMIICGPTPTSRCVSNRT